MTSTTHHGGYDGRRWRKLVWGIAGGLFLVPVVASQLTEEMQWDGADFLFAAVLLLAAGSAYEIAARVARNSTYLLAAGLAIGFGFVAIWINAAVGIIGSENDPLNLIFPAVLAFGIAGSLVARFRAGGMSYTFAAMAGAHAALASCVLLARLGGPEAIVLIVFFGAVWAICATLFCHSASAPTS